MPDWHAAALALKAVVIARPAPTLRPAPLAIAPPALPDYPVTVRWTRLQWPSPMLIVTFADGELVRAPAVSIVGRATNVGRGLRIAIAFYQSRLTWKMGLRALPRGVWPPAPAITSCILRDDRRSLRCGGVHGTHRRRTPGQQLGERRMTATMSADEVKAARHTIGAALGHTLSQHDLGLMLGLASASAGRTVRNWEADGPTGPAAVALWLMVDCARRGDVIVLGRLPNYVSSS